MTHKIILGPQGLSIMTPNVFLLRAILPLLNRNAFSLGRKCKALLFFHSVSVRISGEVMAVGAWLWALGFLIWPILVHSVGLSCTLQTRPVSRSLYKKGDVIIGGLFPVYVVAPEPDHMFIQRLQGRRCQR